jgi:hypothetical protein
MQSDLRSIEDERTQHLTKGTVTVAVGGHIPMTTIMAERSSGSDGPTRFADPELGDIADIVDTDRYAISDDRARARLVVHARAELASDGCFLLEGFLRPAALATARAELAAVAPKAEVRPWSSSVYARSDTEASLDADDPRRRLFDNLLGHVTRDQIAPDTIVARLYASPVFKSFIADCVGAVRLFEYADPLAGLIATIIPPGGSKAWHYDTNEYVVTIMTQQSQAGGDFVYHPGLRRPGDENLDGLREALDGSLEPTVKSLQPGDMQLFLGRYSLHRVTEVTGDVERHVAVLSYADRPGVIGPVARTRAVYGRVTEAHLIAEQIALAASDGLIL